MATPYEHLRLTRIESTTTRRSHSRGLFAREPDDVKEHAENVWNSFEQARAEQDAGAESQNGYDDRYLFKLQTRDYLDVSALSELGNVELISEESGSVFLAFVDARAYTIFQATLRELEAGGEPKYRRVLWALQEAANWTAEDRKGFAIKEGGFPGTDEFVLDVELWPLIDRKGIRDGFKAWHEEKKILRIADFSNANLVLVRLRVNRQQAELLLNHRDVRWVDLPPRFGVDPSLFAFDISGYPRLESPPESAHSVVVLDSGLASNHPMLAAAVGDAQSFVDHEDESDSTGHGTAVAGIALWGNVEDVIEARSVSPLLWLMSGKVLYADEYDEPVYDKDFIENQITRAVEYFTEAYGARVFNISFGDRNHPYQGGRPGNLAMTIDELARKHDILFVICTGNFRGTDEIPKDWREDYPEYLFSDEASLLDPAPALNALTVGSSTHHEATFSEQRRLMNRELIRAPLIARSAQPSPFTRRGPSVGGAVKPDVIAIGGNRTISETGFDDRGLGRVSTSRDFLSGRVFCEKSGTSFAAPYISHLAGRVFSEVSEASTNLVRALLVAHTEPLPSIESLLHKDKLKPQENRDRVTQVCGYGSVHERSLYRSDENEVVLRSDVEIANNQNHFFELPIPADYWDGRQRQREITIALAHMPAVRSTRKDYKATGVTQDC